MHSLAPDLTDSQLAVAAAEAGAAVVRAAYGQSLSRIAKSGTDFATSADIAAEQAILEVIQSARPGDAFVGEESGRHGPDRPRRTWLVDPLCGTLNFAAQTPLVAVNVAVRVEGVVTAAAVADPLADEVFWTDGTAARLRRRGSDEALVPSAESHLVDVNLDPPFPNAETFRAVHLLADPDFVAQFRPRVLSTTLALAWVAVGRRAAYVTDGDMRGDNVHFASAHALCAAAGCVVTDLRGGPVQSGVNGLLAAADAVTHAQLLELVARQAG